MHAGTHAHARTRKHTDRTIYFAKGGLVIPVAQEHGLDDLRRPHRVVQGRPDQTMLLAPRRLRRPLRRRQKAVARGLGILAVTITVYVIIVVIIFEVRPAGSQAAGPPTQPAALRGEPPL